MATVLRRPAEYGQIFLSRHLTQYAVKQLELHISNAKARLAELHELLPVLWDDTTDQVTYQVLLRTWWMLERWVSSVKKEALCASTSTGRPILPDPVIHST